MLRFVVGPERQLVFDAAGKLPGRGLWLSASGRVVNEAAQKNLFARAAKTQVRVPADLSQIVQAELRQRIFDYCGLARRAGIATSGFEKAREWLTAGKAGVVLQAIDGSAEERARFIGGRDVPVVAVLDALRLGAAFGRDHAVHAVIAPGRLAEQLCNDAMRLAGVAGEV